MITIADVEAARVRTAGYVRRTPAVLADPDWGAPVWFKAEFLQRCGVFKTRGAFNRQLAARERGELDPRVGVVAASGGNAGLANAYAAAALGIPATVFVPETAPQVKVDRLHAYGATVQLVGAEYAEAFEAAREHVASTGALLCHAYDQPDIGAGSPVDISVSGIAADSLGARRIGQVAFEIASRTQPVSVLVDDDAIVAAREQLWDDYRIPAEHGAATAFAALTAGAYKPSAGENVAVVICGANTDLATLGGMPGRAG